MTKTMRRPRLIIFNLPLFIAIITIMVVASCVLTAGVTYLATMNSDKIVLKVDHEKVVKEKDQEIAELNKKLETISGTYEKEIAQISEERNDYKSQLDYLNKNVDYLVDKYSYYFRDKAKRSTVTLSQLAQIDKIGKEKNINPHVVMTLIYRESTWNTKSEDTSGNSTSKGYGQFLASTGKTVYHKMLQRGGTYNHREIATNPKTGIEMIYAYLDYLYKDSKDMRAALVRYNGSYRKEEYAESINKYMISNGLGSLKTPQYR